MPFMVILMLLLCCQDPSQGCVRCPSSSSHTSDRVRRNVPISQRNDSQRLLRPYATKFRGKDRRSLPNLPLSLAALGFACYCRYPRIAG